MWVINASPLPQASTDTSMEGGRVAAGLTLHFPSSLEPGFNQGGLLDGQKIVRLKVQSLIDRLQWFLFVKLKWLSMKVNAKQVKHSDTSYLSFWSSFLEFAI